MKKIAFFCCAVLALGFASCDDKSDLGTLQTNPQLPAVVASELQPALSAELAANAINLNGQTEIPAISAPAIENMPAGAEVEYEMELATKADFSNAVTIAATDGKVPADAWNEYFRANLGNANVALPNYIRFAAYFVQGSQRYRVGDLDTWYGSKSITVTPVTFTYETATINADGGAKAIANFSGDGVSFQGFVMINSEFTVTYDGKTYGRKTASALEEGNTPCTVRQAGLYFVEFTADKLTYKATKINTLGAIGDFNKWARQVNLTQNAYVFTGEVDFGTPEEGNTFKFRMNNNNTLTLGGFQYDLIPGGENIEAPGTGAYTFTVDLSTIPYKYTFVKK